jgi:hypothetical protein
MCSQGFFSRTNGTAGTRTLFKRIGKFDGSISRSDIERRKWAAKKRAPILHSGNLKLGTAANGANLRLCMSSPRRRVQNMSMTRIPAPSLPSRGCRWGCLLCPAKRWRGPLAFVLVWSKVTHRANAPLLFDNPEKTSHHQGAKARREGQGQRIILNVGF